MREGLGMSVAVMGLKGDTSEFAPNETGGLAICRKHG
tara:strand:- start:98 stop:208 length:111 start_codon:yes stop_codon:yes gene_type:complete